MSNKEAILNFFGQLTPFNIEMRALPDDLKCAQCKSVLKDACQVPCGCRFCRTCIDNIISSGDQFCLGGSQECGGTPLSTAAPDYRANRSIMKLTAKCSHAGCSHKCPLADMEIHMCACPRRNIDCPFRELGCPHAGLAAADMSSHMQQESGSHSEILIGLVAGIKKDMEVLKQEMKLITDENKSIKLENESMKNEIRSINIQNESIKREKELLSKRVHRLAERLEQQIYEQDHFGISAFTGEVASDRLIKQQVPAKLDDWLIDLDLYRSWWKSYNDQTSFTFSGMGCSYTYELAALNHVKTAELRIQMRIWADPSDILLEWPFRGAVTITVAHRDNAKKCSRQTVQCIIERPPDNRYKWSDPIKFKHATLRGAGLDLERGVRVSCQIVPGAGQ